MDRPSWTQYFIDGARWASSRASCRRAKVGAVIVRDHRILATGYNGAAPGEVDCIEAQCLMEDGHCQRALHAEVNAIAFAARFGVNIDGGTMYLWGDHGDGVPMAPCRECVKVLKPANIASVIGADGEQVWPEPQADICGDDFMRNGVVVCSCALPAEHVFDPESWHHDGTGKLWAPHG